MQPVLALASFVPGSIEVAHGGQATEYRLPGGMVELRTADLEVPNVIELRNTGDAPVYLWWVELHDTTPPPHVSSTPYVLVQAIPEIDQVEAAVDFDLRVYTQPLPSGWQKLTGLIIVSYTEGDRNQMREVGRWVFFPQGDQPLRLTTNLESLTARLSSGDRVLGLPGEAYPAGDGVYEMTLLLANDTQIVYATRLLSWEIHSGAARNVLAESVRFDVVSLPEPAVRHESITEDQTFRLNGYTLPNTPVRPEESIVLSLVWQSLVKLDQNLRARILLQDEAGVLAEATLPIGAAEHGTGVWQEGEISEQVVSLVVPPQAKPGQAMVVVELLDETGQRISFAGSKQQVVLTEVEISPTATPDS